MATKKKNMKVGDMKPSKDAKGGRLAAGASGRGNRNSTAGRTTAGRTAAGRTTAGRTLQ
ncbi:MAG: hypothetical protein ABI674_01845 [Spartobacteria bacterium]